MISILTFSNCKQRKKIDESSYLDSPRAKLDSQNRANEFAEFAENCDENKVKAKFLEWMELYYPDWPIKGKVKVFEAPQDQASIFGKPCPYNIRFQTVDPHMRGFGDKEIIIVRFDWNDSRFQDFSIKPVRGTLYWAIIDQ